MESTVALDMVLELHALRVGVEYVVYNDDSTIRAHLHYIGAHKGGKIHVDVPQPLFVQSIAPHTSYG